MRVGESKTSKYGGVSGLTGRLRNFSGDLAATEASLERKGSLGLMGGMGILAAALAPMQEAAKRVLSGLLVWLLP